MYNIPKIATNLRLLICSGMYINLVISQFSNEYVMRLTWVYERRNWPHLEKPRKTWPASMADIGTASFRQKANLTGSLVN